MTSRPVFRIEQDINGSPERYHVEVGGTLDANNTADYLTAGLSAAANIRNIREEPRFQPNVFLSIENRGPTDVLAPRVVVNDRRNWRTAADLLAEITRPGMVEEDVALAIFAFFSRHDVQAHNNFLRVDDFLPSLGTGLEGSFAERADPIKAINCYYCSGCILSAANMVLLAREAGLEARMAFAATPEGPHDTHCGAEIRYGGAYHFFDPEARTFFLRKDNLTIASYADLSSSPELVMRGHSHGFAAQECRGAFIRHYREHFPPWHVPVARQVSRMDFLLRPQERLVHRWDHQGKYRYGTNNRGTPGVPFQLSNGLMAYVPSLDDLAYRSRLLEEYNVSSTAEDGRSPRLHSLRCGRPSLVTFQVECPYPIVGGVVGATFRRCHGEELCRISVCKPDSRWRTVWDADVADSLVASVAIDDVLAPLHAAPIHTYFVRYEFMAKHDWCEVGLDHVSLETIFQAAATGLPALSVGRNDVEYQDDNTNGRRVRIVHAWRESEEACPPEAPTAAVTPPDGSCVARDAVDWLEWTPAADLDGRGISDYHVFVSSRADCLVPLAPNFDRLTFSPELRWRLPRGFLSRGQRYYWRIRARSARGVWSKWSDLWSFVTE